MLHVAMIQHNNSDNHTWNKWVQPNITRCQLWRCSALKNWDLWSDVPTRYRVATNEKLIIGWLAVPCQETRARIVEKIEHTPYAGLNRDKTETDLHFWQYARTNTWSQKKPPKEPAGAWSCFVGGMFNSHKTESATAEEKLLATGGGSRTLGLEEFIFSMRWRNR